MNKKLLAACILLVTACSACKKSDVLSQYEGNHIIQVPVRHPSVTYFVTDGDTSQLWLGQSNPLVWNFKLIDDNNFIISVANKPDVVLYADTTIYGEIGLVQRPAGSDDRMYFAIESGDDKMVRIRPAHYSDRYVVIGYCDDGFETLSYVIQTGDPNNCEHQTFNTPPDSCYCISQFILQKPQ